MRCSSRAFDHLMLALGAWCLFFAIMLGVVPGCGGLPYVPGPTPPPIPTPTPEPTPTPQPDPPMPTPTAHTVTPAEYDAVVVNVTTEQEIIERFGSPLRRSPIYTPGTVALVYPATDAAGASLAAEFWVLNGVVINKNRL